MHLKHLAATAAALLALAGGAFAQTQPIPGAITASGQPATVNGASLIIAPAANAVGRGNPVAVDRGLPVNCIAGCSGGGGGGGGMTATAAPPVYVEGSANNPPSSDLAGNQRVIVVPPVGIKGTNGTSIASDANPVPVTIVSGGGGGGGATVTATAANPTYVEGSTNNPLSANLSGELRVTTGSGTLNSNTQAVGGNAVNTGAGNAGTGTQRVILATDQPAVAVTGPVTDTQLRATPLSVSGTVGVTGVSTAANQTAVTGSKAAGTAAASSTLTGGVYNSSLPTLSNGQQAAVQMSASGRVLTDGSGVTQPVTGTVAVTGVATAALQGAQGTGSQYNPPTGGSGEIGYLSGLYAQAVSTTPVTVINATSDSTNASTTVTTGGTFQSVLASNASRKFCTIQNPVAAVETLFVYFGATGSATTANSFSLAPGATASCWTGSYILTDNVAVSAATTAHAFVVNHK